MSSFTQFSGKLNTVKAPEASKYLKGKYRYIDPSFWFYLEENKLEIVEIEKGYLSDGASVPRFVRWMIRPWGSHGQCAVVHDKLCETWSTSKRKLETRKEVDEIFFQSMKVAKVNIFRRKAIELGVNLYRWWANPKKPSPSGMKDVFSAEYRRLNP